jgi:non-heme chloroperoxidase
MHRWPGARGVTIAADSWGDSPGPLVVLLHGGGQTRHAWKGTGETLAEAGYRVVAYDARGHGDSDWAPPDDYTAQLAVADLLAVIEAAEGERPALVGASMGGGTSLLAIGGGSVEASALVLVDMAPRIEAEGRQKIQDFMNQKPNGFESLEEVAEAIANYQPHRPRPRSLDGLAKNVRIGEDGRYYWHWDPARRRFRAENFGDYERRLEESARNLSLPTLLVRGGLSDVVSEEGARSFLEQVPHAEYVNVENAAHMVAGDRNDIFGQAVVDFLGREVSVGADSGGARGATALPAGGG